MDRFGNKECLRRGIFLDNIRLSYKQGLLLKVHSSSIDNKQLAFVPIPDKILFLVISFVLFYLVLVGIFNISQAESSLLLIYISFVAYILVLMYPVAFHCKTWGWFHPLVLSSLWTLLSSVLPSSFLYINGLDNHVALSELSKEELNNLVTYNLILQTIALFLTYLGYFLLPKLRITKLYIHWKPPRHLMTKLIIIACISSIALLILSNVMGGLGSLLLERGIPKICEQLLG